MVPGEAPEGVSSCGECLRDTSQNTAHGLAGTGGESCQVKCGRMIGESLRGVFRSGRRRLDCQPLDFKRLPGVQW